MGRELEAQQRFCAAAWPRLVGAMSHYCGDVSVAEELVQEALLRACGRWAHVSSLGSPEGWTYKVAVNLANSRWRRQRAERRARIHLGPATERADIAPVETQLDVRAALRTLTEPQREAVILRYMLDLSAEQTAEVLGTTPGAVRALTHRGAERLRSVLGEPVAVTEEPDDV